MTKANCPTCKKTIYYFIGEEVVCCHCGDEVVPENRKYD